jgi:hypothetical protein
MQRMIMACAIVAMAACGGTDQPQGSCTVTHQDGAKNCVDYSAASLDMWKSGCTNANGSWASTACSHANAAGGCQISQDGVTITTWEYSPVTADMVKQTCPSPGVFVAP